MTTSGDAGEDLAGGFGPDEGLGVPVRDFDVPLDGRLQLSRAAMDAAPQLFVGERREPALNQVDPRGAGRPLLLETEHRRHKAPFSVAPPSPRGRDSVSLIAEAPRPASLTIA